MIAGTCMAVKQTAEIGIAQNRIRTGALSVTSTPARELRSEGYAPLISI